MPLRTRIPCAVITCAIFCGVPLTSSGQTSGNAGREAAKGAPHHSLAFLMEGDSFVTIPAGEFTMGSASGNPDEAPPHPVRVSQPFEMSRFEITQAQWRAVMENPHSKQPKDAELQKAEPSHFKGPDLPVESVSWPSVQEFISTLNKRDKRYVYRLPTEAEWEYAAVTGQPEKAAVDTLGWCEKSSSGRTHTIGEQEANKWGLYDMIGNVTEWVQDWYSPDYYDDSPRVDPRGPASGSYKVYRGGAWHSASAQCRPSFRGFDFPSSGYYYVGFRLVRTRK